MSIRTMSAAEQHEQLISYPNSLSRRSKPLNGYRITRDRLESYLQILPARVQRVFREKIAQNPSLNTYGFHSGHVQRDFPYLGQRWTFHFYEMGPPLAENIISMNAISTTTSPLYAFCATDVEIEQIPLEIDPAARVTPPESKGCMDYLMDFLNTLIDLVKRCVRYLFCCPPPLATNSL